MNIPAFSGGDICIVEVRRLVLSLVWRALPFSQLVLPALQAWQPW
jgi:hypothetical protein